MVIIPSAQPVGRLFARFKPRQKAGAEEYASQAQDQPHQQDSAYQEEGIQGGGGKVIIPEIALQVENAAQCQLLFNISDNYTLTSAEWPPGSVTVSGAW